MVQTSVHSTNNNVLVIPLPEQYRGKDIEVLIYSKDELVALQPKQTVSMADFVGTISKENAQELRTHTEKTRTEWDRDF
jgi:uncharacterized protein YfdQ (DUF2303 family)